MEDSLPARKRRKGGLHQRQASAKEAVSCPSKLHELLMQCLAQGLLSAALVYNIGSAAQRDLQKTREGYLVTNLEQISNLKFGRNLTRSLESHLQNLADVPEPLSINIPLAGVPASADSSLVLLPHEQFAHMFTSGEGWGASILPDAGALETFWNSFDHHPCMQGHPVLKKPDRTSKAVPIMLHGDEVPVMGVGKIWCHSVLAFSWCSLMSVASGRSASDAMVYVWGVFEKYILPTTSEGMGTIDSFFKLLSWSFGILFTGKWPHTNWKGEKHLDL